MILTSEEEQISLPFDNGKNVIKSVLMDSSPNSIDGLSPVSGLAESPREVPEPITDVNVIAKQEKDELELNMKDLEGKLFWDFNYLFELMFLTS